MALLSVRSRLVVAGALLMAFAHALPLTAHAEVRVEGQIDSVSVEVRDASVHETLEALGTKFGLLVRSSVALDKRVNGTYRGSLRQVLARLLAGRDYLAIYSSDGIEIRILGPGDTGQYRLVVNPPAVHVVPKLAPAVAAPAPVSSSSVDKGRLMFVPR
jgi:hypothetical protein